MHPVAIQQPWTGLRQITMPDLIGLFRERNTEQLTPAAGIKYAEFHFFRTFGKNGEVYSFSVPASAEWVRSPRPHRRLCAHKHECFPRLRVINLQQTSQLVGCKGESTPATSLTAGLAAIQPTRTDFNSAQLSTNEQCKYRDRWEPYPTSGSCVPERL